VQRVFWIDRMVAQFFRTVQGYSAARIQPTVAIARCAGVSRFGGVI
jgi:hypothetical protein